MRAGAIAPGPAAGGRILAVGLVREMAGPPNGHVVRGPEGEPTGKLQEEAAAWAQDRLPGPGPAERRAGLPAAKALANARGLTGILDPRLADGDHTAACAALAAESGLTPRAGGTVRLRPGEPLAAALFTAFDAARSQIAVHVTGEAAARAAPDALARAGACPRTGR